MKLNAEWVAFLLIIMTLCFTVGYNSGRLHPVCEAGTAFDPWALVSEGK